MQTGRKRIAHRTRLYARSAFTLIELLVTITIIALLISLLAPALKEARLTARQLKEQSALRSFMQAYVNYATTYKDAVVIPGVPWSWAHPQANSTKFAGPPDLLNGPNPNGVVAVPSQNGPTIAADADVAQTTAMRMPGYSGAIIEGSCVKVWPLRFWGLMEYPSHQLQIDGATYNSFFARSKVPTATQTLNPGPSAEAINTYDSGNTFLGALSYHPSWGLNAIYIGGHYRFGAYLNATSTTLGNSDTKWFARYTYNVQKSSHIMTAMSARSYDLIGSSMAGAGYGGGPVPGTAQAAIIPGHHMVLPPRTGYPTAGGTAITWSTSNSWDPRSAPQTWGYIDFRWKGKGVAGYMDGHVELQNITQIRDMRKWTDKAKTADWIFSANNN